MKARWEIKGRISKCNKSSTFNIFNEKKLGGD